MGVGCDNPASSDGASSANALDKEELKKGLTADFAKRLECPAPLVTVLDAKPKYLLERDGDQVESSRPDLDSAAAKIPVSAYFEVRCGDQLCTGTVRHGQGKVVRSHHGGQDPAQCKKDTPVSCARVGFNSPPNEDPQAWARVHLGMACDAGASAETCMQAAMYASTGTQRKRDRADELHARACLRGADSGCRWWEGSTQTAAYRYIDADDVRLDGKDGLSFDKIRLRTITLSRRPADARWPGRVALVARGNGLKKEHATTLVGRCKMGEAISTFTAKMTVRKVRKPGEDKVAEDEAEWILRAKSPPEPSAPCDLQLFSTTDKDSPPIGQLCWSEDKLVQGACAGMDGNDEAKAAVNDVTARLEVLRRPGGVEKTEHKPYELVLGFSLTQTAGLKPYGLRAKCKGHDEIKGTSYPLDWPHGKPGDRVQRLWVHPFAKRPTQCSFVWEEFGKDLRAACFRDGKLTDGQCDG